jgi:hypothetical protein
MAEAAPRTWFERREVSERDPDSEAWLAVGAILIALAAPLALALALLLYLAGRAAGLRWWWLAITGAMSALGIALTLGPDLAAANYAGAYREAATDLTGAGGLRGLRWEYLAGMLLPVSLPLSLLTAAAGLLYTSLRRPAWRDDEPRVSARRRARAQGAIQRAPRVGDNGWVMGVDVDTARVIAISDDALGAHALVCGASRAGKSVLVEELARAAIATGHGWVHVDLKGDPDVITALRAEAARWGRSFSCFSLSGGDAWNPLAHGDPSELKDKLIGLECWTEPHYQRAAERYLQLVFRALGKGRTLSEVVGLLDPKRLGTFARRLPEQAGDALCAYADGLTRDQQSAVAGLATRLALLAESTAGPLLDGDGIDLRAVGPEGRVVVFSLDSGRYPGLAAQLGTLVLQDLKAAAGAALRSERRRWYVAVDEFSVVSDDHLLGLLARGAAAGVAVILATQELADLERAAPGFRDQVLGNTAVKFTFRQDVPASAELWAQMAGTSQGWQETLQTAHRSASPISAATGGATGVGTIRRVEEFRVHPNVIKTLPQGRCVVIRKHPRFAVELVDVVRTPKAER